MVIEDYSDPEDYYVEQPAPLASNLVWLAYSAAWHHYWNIQDVMGRGLPPDRQLPSGLSQPGWLGHRDLCPIQWGDPCDCALPPRTTPCVCRYWTEAYDLRVSTSDPAVAHEYVWPPATRSGFTINPRCVHHGDPARTPTPPACTCPGPGTHPDCRRHNYDPTEDGPQPIHDHPHNPYDLDEDERHA